MMLLCCWHAQFHEISNLTTGYQLLMLYAISKTQASFCIFKELRYEFFSDSSALILRLWCSVGLVSKFCRPLCIRYLFSYCDSLSALHAIFLHNDFLEEKFWLSFSLLAVVLNSVVLTTDFFLKMSGTNFYSDKPKASVAINLFFFWSLTYNFSKAILINQAINRMIFCKRTL